MRNQDSEGKSVSSIDERRLVIAEKKLFFNCTRGQHRARDFRSIRTYFSFKGKHDNSICDKESNPLLATRNSGKYRRCKIPCINRYWCRCLICLIKNH